MDILKEEFLCQFTLLIWTSFIGQFVHTVGGDEIGLRGCTGGVLLFLRTASITLSEYMKM